MDIILDSNVFVRDVSMKHNQFAELFVYLRRTGSNFVVPLVVFQEVIERYREDLKNEVQKVEAAWSRLSRKTISTVKEWPLPKVNEEVTASGVCGACLRNS
jgi:predicted nucleic acid-binding protein